MQYNWQMADWPQFKYDLNSVEDHITQIIELMGQTHGMASSLPKNIQSEAMIHLMVIEALKTSEIEGEYLSRQDVLSSIRNNLGLNDTKVAVHDKKAQGVAELMNAVRKNFQEPLTQEELFSWHSMLMKGNNRVKTGAWRIHEEPMQVISGPIGRVTVHFEAPPSKRVTQEMISLLHWFNQTHPKGLKPIKMGPVRSAIAHLYFETIHPFEDGNGRIGRALSEKALSQSIGRPVFLSLSKVIKKHKSDYYEALKKAQRSNEITPWIEYFVDLVLHSQLHAKDLIEFTVNKIKFFDHYQKIINSRQLIVLQRMLENGPDGFEGGMSPKKYIKIAKTSKPTATRDLQDMVQKGALTASGEGRSRRYHVKLK